MNREVGDRPAQDAQGLPDFDWPPVNETALSVQFAPIARIAPLLGLFWSRIRAHYPKSEVLPPLPTVTEDLGKPLSRPKFGLKLLAEPIVRQWYLREDETELIQLQSDHFVYNWRQVTGEERYPRYASVRGAFEREFSQFLAFVHDEVGCAVDVKQCEVVYVNHLEYGQGWADFAELNKVISPWSGRSSGRFLPPPESVNIETHYRLPNNQGRLHIAVEPVVRGRDSKEVLQITLTTRGAPSSSAITDILAWMDLGRRWIVHGFCDFTTTSMHDIWGLRNANDND